MKSWHFISRLIIVKFEKIIVIGLPTRTDRRDAIALSAALSNIDVEFFDGVPGETVQKKVLPLGADL
jgi:ribosomal protein L30E